MNIIIKLFNIVAFTLLLNNSVLAMDKFSDFPVVGQKSGDISLEKSEIGKSFVKIALSSHENANDNYVLVYKTYNINGDFKGIKQVVQKGISVFNIEIGSFYKYQFCIVTLHDGSIDSVSPIEELHPGDMLYTKKIISKSIKRASTLSGVDLNLEIDNQSFPYINLLAQITSSGKNYDGTSHPVLNSSNFNIEEDNRIQSISKILPPSTTGTKKIADIVFVHDDSGSLDSEAAQVKANIKAFLNGLDASGIDYRIGLLPYAGAGHSNSYSGPGGTLKHGGNLHTNSQDLISDINLMKFDGSNERAFDAMYLASNSTLWRQSTQKIIILITDENNDYGKIDESTLIANLKKNNITVFGLTKVGPEFNRIAAATGGKIYNVTDDFKSILTDIGANIVAKYIIRYKTDNTKLDGKERTASLNVKVDNSNGTKIGGAASIKYTPTVPLEIFPTIETEKLSAKGQRDHVTLNISAKITQAGNGDPISATLFYRNINSSSYSSIDMTDIGNGIYKAAINSSIVINPKVEYYISASNGSDTYTYPSNEPGNNPIIVSILPNISPEIQSVNISNAKVNSDITVNAVIEDRTNEVDKVTLYYREQGSSLYTEVSSIHNTPIVNFKATIPSSAVTENGLEFYIDAIDDFGVHKTYGSATTPKTINITAPTVNNGFKDIGNITVYADNFIENRDKTWTGSGHVTIAKKLGNKILSLKTSVILNYTTNTVITLSSTDIVALAMKRNSNAEALDIPLYKGNIEVDCSANPPVMNLKNGTSTFRPMLGLNFFYPNQAKLTLKKDEVVFSDIYTTLSSLNLSGSIKDLVLSQVGNSSQQIDLKFDGLADFIKLQNSVFELKDLALSLDIVKQSVTGSAFIGAEKIFGKHGGIGGTLGFTFNPFELNTLGAKIGLNKATSVLMTLPTTPPSPFGVRLSSGSFLVDGISSGQDAKISATGDTYLVDALFILESFQKAIGKNVISGDTTILIDTSGKVVASGNIKLLESLDLASAKLTLGNPTSLEANLNILQTVTGRLFLQLGTNGSYVELIGQSDGIIQIPPQFPWIGGMKFSELALDTTLRFNKKETNMAEIRAKIQIFFAEFGWRLNISDVKNPHLYITGFGKRFPAFSRTRSLRKVAQETVNVTQAPYVFIKVISNDTNSSADFDVTLPDGTKYTPQTAVANANSGNIDKIFFMKNSYAKEAYYAIKNPSTGKYLININNNNKLGGYRVEVVYPNDKPEITVNNSNDTEWDGSSPFTISWTDKDDDSNATISLYYSKENSGHRGTLIATDISEDSAIDQYDWKPSKNIQSGEYYIFAKIDDGEYSPVFSYGAGKILIKNNNAPQSPQNVVATPMDGAINVKWDSADANTTYRVYISDGNKEHDFASGTNNEYTANGLKNDTDYSIKVLATNHQGYDSLFSESKSVRTPFNANNPGGSPDLIIDTLDSNVSSLHNKIDGNITLNVVVKNIGDTAASYAKLNCYYGNMSDKTLVGSKILGNISKDGNASVTFSFNTSDIDQNESRTFYISVGDVVSSEVNTDNNQAVLKSRLSKKEDINNDFEINIVDLMKLSILIDNDDQSDLSFDINKDGVINKDDLNLVKKLWGTKY